MKNQTECTIDPRLAGVRLRSGPGSVETDGPVPSNAQLCAMQWVSVLAGATNGKITDDPVCACPVIRGIVIRANDNWPDADRQKLLVLIPLLVDSKATREVERKRGYFFADWAVRTLLPRLCDRAKQADAGARLRALGPVTDRASAELARQEARSVRDILRAADAAYADAAYAYAAYAYAAYADAAADAAADADAAAYAAYDAAYAADAYADAAADASEIRGMFVQAIKEALAIE